MGKEAIYAVRGHEFHNMLLEIDQRFHDFKNQGQVEYKGVKMYKLQAKDELNNECSLFFDIKTGLFTAVNFQNPDSTQEIIKTEFSGWEKVQDLLLPQRVDIDQSGKMFTFDITKLVFNSPDFKYKNVKK